MEDPSVSGVRSDLLKAAKGGTKVTYGQLMKKHGLSRGRRLSRLISQVDSLEYARGAPGFATIIVRKDTSFPGGGYFCDDGLPCGLIRASDKSTDPRLTPREKEHILAQQARIWAFYSKA